MKNSAPIFPTGIIRTVSVTVALLLVPLIAMQFSSEIQWSPLDFAVAGSLLLGTGLGYELVKQKTRSIKLRLLFGGSILAIMLLVWAQLAVGIFE